MSTPLVDVRGVHRHHPGHHLLGGAASAGASAYFAAGRQITGWQNGIAVAGDYMSAASFLGIAGLIAFHGYDGFMYSVGWLVAYLTVLLIVAEPLRNAGKYTMADVLAYRLNPRPVRAMAALSTLTVSTFYMIAQMVGAGTLVALLLKDSGISFNTAVIGVGILMIVYVVFGGMLATTWVQIIKAILLMAGTFLLSILVLAHFDFSFGEFFDAVSHVTLPRCERRAGRQGLPAAGLALQATVRRTRPDLARPGADLRHRRPAAHPGPLLHRARRQDRAHSVVWAMVLIGTFYIMTTFLGFGAATIVGPDFIKAHGGTNMSAPLLAQALAGNVFFAFISAIAFATILAVVAGLTISASTSFAHDFWTNVIHSGVERKPGEEVLVARIAAFVVGAISILLAILLADGQRGVPGRPGLRGRRLGQPAGDRVLDLLAALQHRRRGRRTRHRPARLARLDHRQPQHHGRRSADRTGAARHLIQAKPLFPLENPGILSIPLGFLAAVIATLLTHEPTSETKFNELLVRSNTGLGAERATATH